MKITIAIMFLVNLLGLIATIGGVITGVSTSTLIGIVTVSFLISVGFAAWQIYGSQKENTTLTNNIVSLQGIIQQSHLFYLLDKAHQSWVYQKQNFNMHLEGEKGKKTYIEILKSQLTKEQILFLKGEGRLDKIYNPQDGGIVELEIKPEDLT